MAMITGFLLAYMCFTAPIIGWGVWRAMKGEKADKVKEPTSSELENIIKTAFGSKGIAVKVHEMPKTALEAIMVRSAVILAAIEDCNKTNASYLTAIFDKSKENKADMQALIQAVHAITKGMTEVVDKVGKPLSAQGSIDNFVHNLEYARDVFAKTPTQKKAVESIILNIKSSHGTKSK